MDDDVLEAREAAEMEWVVNYEEKQEFKNKILGHIERVQEKVIAANNEVSRLQRVIHRLDDDLVALRSMIEDE